VSEIWICHLFFVNLSDRLPTSFLSNHNEYVNGEIGDVNEGGGTEVI